MESHSISSNFEAATDGDDTDGDSEGDYEDENDDDTDAENI